MRSVRTSSGTTSSQTLVTSSPDLARSLSSASACATVRGNPSSKKPVSQSDRRIRSAMMAGGGAVSMSVLMQLFLGAGRGGIGKNVKRHEAQTPDAVPPWGIQAHETADSLDDASMDGPGGGSDMTSKDGPSVGTRGRGARGGGCGILGRARGFEVAVDAALRGKAVGPLLPHRRIVALGVFSMMRPARVVGVGVALVSSFLGLKHSWT